MSNYGQNNYGAPPQSSYGQSTYGAPNSYGQQPAYGQTHGQSQLPHFAAPQSSYGGPQQSQHQYGAPQQSQYGGPASYGAPPPAGQGYGQAPPAAGRQRHELQSYFSAVDQDRSGQISALELSAALVNGNFTPFDPKTVGMLIRMFDKSNDGTIGFDEFVGLWGYIEQWQGIFRRHDRDQSGTIEPQELENALREFGFSLSPQVVSALVRKFSAASPQRGPGGFAIATQRTTFDGFIACCVSVKSLSETFGRYDTQRSGIAQFRYEDFLTAALSAP